MSIASATGVDRENPWPGLASFTEEISQFFFGRDEEAKELFRLAKRETVTRVGREVTRSTQAKTRFYHEGTKTRRNTKKT